MPLLAVSDLPRLMGELRSGEVVALLHPPPLDKGAAHSAVKALAALCSELPAWEAEWAARWGGCTRCGHNSHAVDACYATKHADGRRIVA